MTMPEVTEAGAVTAEGNAPAEGRKSSGKIAYPNIPDEGLMTWPDDFNPKIHSALRESDFVDPCTFHEHKIKESLRLHERRTKKHKTAIALFQAFGGDHDAVRDMKAAVKSIMQVYEMQKKFAGNNPNGVNFRALLEGFNLPEVVVDMFVLDPETAELSSEDDDEDDN